MAGHARETELLQKGYQLYAVPRVPDDRGAFLYEWPNSFSSLSLSPVANEGEEVSEEGQDQTLESTPRKSKSPSIILSTDEKKQFPGPPHPPPPPPSPPPGCKAASDHGGDAAYCSERSWSPLSPLGSLSFLCVCVCVCVCVYLYICM